ncbi:MAG: FecR domain-containing protein, partial [Propionivibrio sp.]
MKHASLRAALLALQLAVAVVLALGPIAAIRAEAQEEVHEEAPVWRYTVKPGDNLINIAERYFVDAGSWPYVQQANRIADPRRILPGTVLRISAYLLRQEPAQAMVDKVSGEVRWRTGDGQWQAASSGLRLASGAVLETLDDASAVLVFADESRIVVAPNSLVALDSLSLYADGLMVDTRLRLQRGQTDIEANPEQKGGQNLQIRTPSAQAVVRGTRFRVGAGADRMRDETLGGLVAVAGAGKGVDVPAGRGTVARTGAPPIAPVPLLAAPDVGGLPTRFEQLPLRFPLPTLAAASAWEGQIAPDVSFERILLSKTATGPALTFADLPNGDYVLRLRAVDANGLRGFDALHRFVVFARPFPPGLNSPGDGATVRSARPPFAWSDVVDIAGYHLQVATDADFSSPLYDETLTGIEWSPAA